MLPECYEEYIRALGFSTSSMPTFPVRLVSVFEVPHTPSRKGEPLGYPKAFSTVVPHHRWLYRVTLTAHHTLHFVRRPLQLRKAVPSCCGSKTSFVARQ